jgi:hypothetical protein
MGITHEEMMDLFDTTNLNESLRGTNGKYDAFDTNEARERAAYLERHIENWEYVLCCGAKVCALMRVKPYTWTSYSDSTTVRFGMPHPGGTNMHWNNKDNIAKAQRELKALVDMVKGIRVGQLP